MRMWKTIYDYLKSKGFDVYALGQHEGTCKTPYIVIRNNGDGGRGITMEQTLYELLLYYPSDFYYQFEDYIDSVKQSMNGLFPILKLVDGPSPHYLDPDVLGYMTNLTYRLIKESKVNRN